MLSTDGATGSGKTMAELLKQKFGPRMLKKNWKIANNPTLFGPDWSLLAQGKCPHCAHRLYMMPSKPEYLRCKSKQHKKSFVIHTSKIDDILAKL